MRQAEGSAVGEISSLQGLASGYVGQTRENQLEEQQASITVTSDDFGDISCRVLDMVVRQYGSRGGVLYLNTTRGLERSCVTEGFETPQRLDSEVRNYYATEIGQAGAPATVTAFDEYDSNDKTKLRTPLGEHLVPFVLEYPSDRGFCSCGLIVLAVDQEDRRFSRLVGLHAIAKFLSEQPEIVSSPIE